jgi:hypothetical protein
MVIYIDGWTDDYAGAVEQASLKSLFGRPLQDPKSKRWCFDPEQGLSGFAFHDLPSLREAMSRIKLISTVGLMVKMYSAAQSFSGLHDLTPHTSRGCWILPSKPWLLRGRTLV